MMEQKAKLSMEDFTQLRLLGRGSYGEVYLVEKKDNKNVYALKTMDKVHMAREKKQHHVYVEREVLSSFKSPWIIELHNCFQDKSRLYFLLENVRNGELAEYLRLHQRLDLEQTRFIAAEIVVILEFLRKCGIVHRDLKPENLLLDEKNHLKVIDFGTGKFIDNGSNHEFIERIMGVKSRFAEPAKHKNSDPDETIHERLEHRNSFVGTPIYLSPELIREEEVSFPADIWALGIMVYQMLAGITPWQSDSDYDLYESIKNKPVEFPDEFDPVARDLVSKLLDKDPNTRLGSGSEESKNGFLALRAHPFFKGIDWDNLRSTPSPIKKAVNPLKTEDKDTDYYKENIRKRKVLLSGLIRKYKKLLFYDTRQLILYDNGTLEYFDPEDGVMKGTIALNSKCSAVKKSAVDFDLSVPNRVYSLKCIEYTADDWVEVLQKEIARLSAPQQRTTTGMTLDNC